MYQLISHEKSLIVINLLKYIAARIGRTRCCRIWRIAKRTRWSGRARLLFRWCFTFLLRWYFTFLLRWCFTFLLRWCFTFFVINHCQFECSGKTFITRIYRNTKSFFITYSLLLYHYMEETIIYDLLILIPKNLRAFCHE